MLLKVFVKFSVLSYRSTQLDLHDCRQWVRSELQTRGANPFEFMQTVAPYSPSQTAANRGDSGAMTSNHFGVYVPFHFPLVRMKSGSSVPFLCPLHAPVVIKQSVTILTEMGDTQIGDN